MILILLAICIPVVSGIIGARIASGRNRSALGWFLICFFLPLLGHILLAVLPAEASAPAVMAQAPVQNQRQRIAHDTIVPPVPVVAHDHARHQLLTTLPPVGPAERWRYLVEYDPLLRDAAERLAPLGTAAVDELRDAFFALQDRNLVPSMVARISERHARLTAPPPPQKTAAMVPPELVSWMTAPIAEPEPPKAAAVETPPRRDPAHREAPLRSVSQFMPEIAARLVPRHTTVTPQDLETAEYVETHRGVHLYRLADGRVYIDGHMAVISLATAHGLIDQATSPPAPIAAHAVVAMHS